VLVLSGKNVKIIYIFYQSCLVVSNKQHINWEEANDIIRKLGKEQFLNWCGFVQNTALPSLFSDRRIKMKKATIIVQVQSESFFPAYFHWQESSDKVRNYKKTCWQRHSLTQFYTGYCYNNATP